MKAGVLFGKGDIRYTDYKTPELAAGQVMVKVHACGICGSDVPRVLGDEAHSYPIILGHEFSGEIVDKTADVSSLHLGDRVAGVPLMPCMKCVECKRGHFSQCDSYGFIGSRQNGAFAQYVQIPAQNAIKIDPALSYETAALMEPSTVALHGVFNSRFTAGNDALIIGAGNIGLFLLQQIKSLGARRVIVADVSTERRELCKKLGAFAALDPLSPDFRHDMDELGGSFPFVYEIVGANETLELGLSLTAPNGCLSLIGTPHTKSISFSRAAWEQINRKELSIKGNWMSYSAPFPGKEWSLSAELLARGEIIIPEGFIFERIPLRDIARAFSYYETPGAVKGKIIITMED